MTLLRVYMLKMKSKALLGYIGFTRIYFTPMFYLKIFQFTAWTWAACAWAELWNYGVHRGEAKLSKSFLLLLVLRADIKLCVYVYKISSLCFVVKHIRSHDGFMGQFRGLQWNVLHTAVSASAQKMASDVCLFYFCFSFNPYRFSVHVYFFRH